MFQQRGGKNLMVKKQKCSEIWRSCRLLRLHAPTLPQRAVTLRRARTQSRGSQGVKVTLPRKNKTCTNASQSLHDPPEVCERSDPLPAFSYYFAVMKKEKRRSWLLNLILR